MGHRPDPEALRGDCQGTVTVAFELCRSRSGFLINKMVEFWEKEHVIRSVRLVLNSKCGFAGSHP